MEVFRTGVPYHAGQVETDAGELLGVREGLGVRSAMMVPLDVNEERRGVVQADSAQPNHFTDDDLAFTEAVAHWVSLLLQRVELSNASSGRPPPKPGSSWRKNSSPYSPTTWAII